MDRFKTPSGRKDAGAPYAGRRRIERNREFVLGHSRTVFRNRLRNGLQTVVCGRRHLARAHVALIFRVGSRYESARTNGLTHMLEHMLFRGSLNYLDATALNAAAEDIGGFLEGVTFRDHMLLATSCHPSGVTEAIKILGEVVSSPRFRAIETERAILREELLETVDGRGRMVDVDNIAHHAVFGPTGLGLPIEGTPDNLERFTREDLRRHRERFLTGANGVLAIAGAVDPEEVFLHAEGAFSGLAARKAPHLQTPAPPPLSLERPVFQFVRDPSSQVDIRVTFRATSVQDPDYPADLMLSHLLTDGLASRLHADLVDRQGLAYAIHGGLTTYEDQGLFEFDVAVAPDRAGEALGALLEFVESSKRFRYGAAEMNRARRRYAYELTFMEDSAADLSIWHGRAALFGITQDLDALEHRMARVDEKQVREAARRLFTRDNLVVTAVGELARGQHRAMRRLVEGF